MADTPAAEPYLRILEVQEHDTTIVQLRHRKATLPERAELSSIETRLAEILVRHGALTVQNDELAGDQAALEARIDTGRRRRDDLERRTKSGAVTAARDLQAIDDETRQLARHITELEDREIEVMEAIEPVAAEMATLDAERQVLEARTHEVRDAIITAEMAIDGDVVTESASRAAAADSVPEDLLARYERLRSKLAGTGAARLVRGSCGGCHLALSSVELDRVRKAPPDELLTCEQCGRILVR
jgi:predicted  nucleic acid-binding Zn-ribbon protein